MNDNEYTNIKNMSENNTRNGHNVSRVKILQVIQKPGVILPVIAFIGLVVRFYFFPYNIPFQLDSVDVFSYAVLTSQQGNFPPGFALANNGWPGFVSIFFSLSNTNDFFDFIHLQRVLSILISVTTIIPVYLLSRRFFDKSFSYVAVALFIFDFRIIIDSLSGGNLPLFIFLISLGIFLFLSKNNKMIYISFGVLALASIIRYEGLLLFIPFSFMFFVKLRKQKKIVLKYLVAISIAILVLLPMAYIRVENTGEDGLTSHILGGISYYNHELLTGYAAQCPYENPSCGKRVNDEPWTKPGQDNVTLFIISGLGGMAFYLMWASIPTFLFFLPASIFFVLKNRSYKKIDNRILSIIVFGLFMLIPAFYAYGRHFQEVKYLYVLFPIIILFFIYGLNIKKLKKSSLFIFIIIGGILFLSLTTLNYKNLNLDYEHEREVLEVTTFIVNNVNGINGFPPESKFVKSAELFKKWPNVPNFNPKQDSHILRDVKIISISDYQSLEEFILDTKNQGLSHILVDGRDGRNFFEIDVFVNEENYPYLIKEYDSKEHGLNYHVKIFKIDYDKFENSEI